MSDSATEASGRRRLLDRFDRAVRLETHNLASWPNLLTQQLYNRLYWHEDVRELAGQRGDAVRERSIWLRTNLPLRESSALIRTIAGHDGPVHTCAASPDGSFLVSGGADSTLRVWDSATGRPRAVIVGHVGPVYACAVSPDGSMIASASGDTTVALWDTAGREQGRLEGHSRPVRACAISPDGSIVASASDDRSVIFWDIASGAPVAELESTDAVMTCAFAPDGTFVAFAGAANTLVIRGENRHIHVHAGTLRGSEFAYGPGGAYVQGVVRGVAMTPDARRVVAAWSSTGQLVIVDAATGTHLTSLSHTRATKGGWSLTEDSRFFRHEVLDCGVSADASLIVSAGADGTIKVWDATTFRHIKTLEGHAGAVERCAVTPDGLHVVSAGSDGTLKLWDLGAPAQASVSSSHPLGIRDCAISPDGTFVATAGEDKTVRAWPWSGKDEATFVGHAERVYSCAVGPDGALLVSGSGDGRLKVWKSPPRRRRRHAARGGNLLGHSGPVRDCAVSSDGSFVVSAGEDATVRVWSVLRRGSHRARAARGGVLEGHCGPVYGCAISPDSSFIVSASADSTVRIWGRERAQLRLLAGHEGEVRACAVSPDGKFIVSGGSDRTLRIWDVATGVHRVLAGHAGPVRGCAVSPDATLVASASDDRTIRLWDAESDEAVGTFPLLGPATCVGFHPSVPLLACGDEGGNLYRLVIAEKQYEWLHATARRRDSRWISRCPGCGSVVSVEESRVGETVDCANPLCGLPLKLNAGSQPFQLSGYTALEDAWRQGRRLLAGWRHRIAASRASTEGMTRGLWIALAVMVGVPLVGFAAYFVLLPAAAASALLVLLVLFGYLYWALVQAVRGYRVWWRWRTRAAALLLLFPLLSIGLMVAFHEWLGWWRAAALLALAIGGIAARAVYALIVPKFFVEFP